jgi:prepilin peptidase CpaA
MPLPLHLAPLAGFVGLMMAAAFEDFRRLVIPNGVIVGLCVLWPLYLLSAPGVTLATVFSAIACGSVVFFVGALLFFRGLVGGGDVKLITAAALWAGPGATFSLLALTGLLGGLLSLVSLLPICRHFLGAEQKTVTGPADVLTSRVNPVAVPYGVAIAAAALIVTVPPSFS